MRLCVDVRLHGRTARYCSNMGYKTFSQKAFLNVFSFWASCLFHLCLSGGRSLLVRIV